MKIISLLIFLFILNLNSFGQSLFFNNLNHTNWISTSKISDSIILKSPQIPLSKLIYPKDSIKENVIIWAFKDSILTILEFNHQLKTETILYEYLYEVIPEKGYLKIATKNDLMFFYEVGITSSGNYAILLKH
ncbi:MAG: hypothetical protein HYR91_00590 [Flavobacteriia bacterium]|nr:hypothetical protein [Flavobacteriia bacterium]